MSFPGLPTKLRWPWAKTKGKIPSNNYSIFIDDYFPYVWTKPDQTWKDGLGPRWNLPPEDLKT